MDTYPRDELFLNSDEQLFNSTLGIYHICECKVTAYILIFLKKSQVIQLSKVRSVLEKFGQSLAEEHTYKVKSKLGNFVWLSDFTLLTSEPVKIPEVNNKLQESYGVTQDDIAENSCFNSLVVYVGLNWREVAIIHTYTGYIWQIGVSSILKILI